MQSCSHSVKDKAFISRLSPDLKQVISAPLAVIYGGTLSQIPSENFKDFPNYLAYAEHSWERFLSLASSDLLALIFNEPVWLLINATLGSAFSPETVVRLIIFLSASTTAWVVFRSHRDKFIWLLILLALPIVVKNNLIHLRQGAAISVFLLGWFSTKRSNGWTLLGLTPFIHSSFFLLLPVLWGARLMVGIRLGSGARLILFVVMGVIAGISVAWLANLLGARQAQTYQVSTTEVSGLSFVLWTGILALFLAEGREFLKTYSFETGVIAFYLSTYWLIEVTARIFESGVLLVLLAGLALTGFRRLAYGTAILIALLLFPWALRIGQPGLGYIAN